MVNIRLIRNQWNLYDLPFATLANLSILSKGVKLVALPIQFGQFVEDIKGGNSESRISSLQSFSRRRPRQLIEESKMARFTFLLCLVAVLVFNVMADFEEEERDKRFILGTVLGLKNKVSGVKDRIKERILGKVSSLFHNSNFILFL